jgi:Trypsin-like peptidase domain
MDGDKDSAAHAQWAALDGSSQFRAALAVARRRGPGWVRQFDNVVTVGAGFRLRGAQDELVREVCLCFGVKRKWHDTRQRMQKIPAHVAAMVERDGRRVRVLIPTDVAEFKRGAPQAASSLTGGITTRRDGQPQDLAAACCVVEDAGLSGQRFLLTCYHAFVPDLRRPIPAGMDATDEAGAAIGLLAEAASASGLRAVDAALVSVDAAWLDTVSVWGLAITQRADAFDIEDLPNRGALWVLGRRVAPASGAGPAQTRSEPVRAQFRQVIVVRTEFDYASTAGRSFVFGEVIEYQAATRPGDSGAALVDSQGLLYGMHFYGFGGNGYAFTAPRLFDDGVFLGELRLPAA